MIRVRCYGPAIVGLTASLALIGCSEASYDPLLTEELRSGDWLLANPNERARMEELCGEIRATHTREELPINVADNCFGMDQRIKAAERAEEAEAVAEQFRDRIGQ